MPSILVSSWGRKCRDLAPESFKGALLMLAVLDFVFVQQYQLSHREL